MVAYCPASNCTLGSRSGLESTCVHLQICEEGEFADVGGVNLTSFRRPEWTSLCARLSSMAKYPALPRALHSRWRLLALATMQWTWDCLANGGFAKLRISTSSLSSLASVMVSRSMCKTSLASPTSAASRNSASRFVFGPKLFLSAKDKRTESLSPSNPATVQLKLDTPSLPGELALAKTT